jgi:hypothetical protein
MHQLNDHSWRHARWQQRFERTSLLQRTQSLGAIDAHECVVRKALEALFAKAEAEEIRRIEVW